jgi:tRNA threonylcarbamoyladenosine biosynthesis protein TsaE
MLSCSAEATEALAEKLAAHLRGGDVITLEAPLGGGKTTFVRGLARGLGADEGEVSSPTFVIWQIYEGGRLRLHHLDAYRLQSESEVEEIGIPELLAGSEVVVIEWPGLLQAWLPADRLHLKFDYAQEGASREIEVCGFGNWTERWQEVCREDV